MSRHTALQTSTWTDNHCTNSTISFQTSIPAMYVYYPTDIHLFPIQPYHPTLPTTSPRLPIIQLKTHQPLQPRQDSSSTPDSFPANLDTVPNSGPSLPPTRPPTPHTPQALPAHPPSSGPSRPRNLPPPRSRNRDNRALNGADRSGTARRGRS